MTMSLIGENMENSNLSILGAGFACLDIIRFKNKDTVMLGGTAANVLTILSLLGLKTEFLTARYYGQSGKFIESAFMHRGVQYISFANTKNQVPKIIEGIENRKHFFVTTCPKCGRNLAKCSLPNLSQMTKVEKQYNKSPNIFFFDRISEGIRECARKNTDGWNVYEPNSCRMYSNLVRGIRVANIVKYSEDRISSKITENVIRDIRNTDVVLLIVTMGEGGIKYVYRTETGELSNWNYIAAVSIDNVTDSSGSGDWLTAILLYLLLRKYPNYTPYLSGQYIERSLIVAQRYAAQNCSFIGAQGMLRERSIVDKINYELGVKVKMICDTEIDWEYSCDYCFSERTN
jgi:fructokinase